MSADLIIHTAAPVAAAQWWPTLHLKKGRKLYAATPEQLARFREAYNAGRGCSECGKCHWAESDALERAQPDLSRDCRRNGAGMGRGAD